MNKWFIHQEPSSLSFLIIQELLSLRFLIIQDLLSLRFLILQELLSFRLLILQEPSSLILFVLLWQSGQVVWTTTSHLIILLPHSIMVGCWLLSKMATICSHTWWERAATLFLGSRHESIKNKRRYLEFISQFSNWNYCSYTYQNLTI